MHFQITKIFVPKVHQPVDLIRTWSVLMHVILQVGQQDQFHTSIESIAKHKKQDANDCNSLLTAGKILIVLRIIDNKSYRDYNQKCLNIYNCENYSEMEKLNPLGQHLYYISFTCMCLLDRCTIYLIFYSIFSSLWGSFNVKNFLVSINTFSEFWPSKIS